MTKKSKVIEKEEVVIRFSGDSGDGMQLTGTLFSDTAALFGNDLSTFPDYPAEIRASGTISSATGFQVHIGHSEINTPGDYGRCPRCYESGRNKSQCQTDQARRNYNFRQG